MNNTDKYEYKLSMVYFAFRVLLASSLIGIALADQQWSLSGNYQTTTFLTTVSIYLALALANLLYTSVKQQPPHKRTTFAAISIDIGFCIGFMHLSGGFATGLGILLLSPIIIGSIFFYGSIALFLAAIAIIGMLLDVLYMASIYTENTKYFIPAGLLGGLFFISSIITQLIARYIRSTEKLVLENIGRARNLSIINETIVQHMLTGIIVIDHTGKIQLSNNIAKQLLNNNLDIGHNIYGKIKEQLMLWQNDNNIQSTPFRDGPGLPIVKINFSRVLSDNGDTIIFIENQSILNQHAQHLKLSSLGRLSASIAHEIRNPLNAISHASQLLLEANDISADNMRLLNMINNHTKRINNIISNVLDISRRAPASPEKILLDPILEKIESHIKDTVKSDVIIEKSIPNDFTVSFDESQLSQVLYNILDNGTRYSAEKSGIYWAKVVASNQDGNPEISIYDKGDGISKDDIEKVFEPFYTSHNEGTGLGLYVSRELCEMNQALLDYLYDANGTGYFHIRFAHPDKKILLN